MFNISLTTATYNPTAATGIKRAIYTYSQDNRVIKSSSKKRVLKLRGKRVANGPLYNNESLRAPLDEISTSILTIVGVLYMGAERKSTVPVQWVQDRRGNWRRAITQKAFRALPQYMQQIAIDKGVDVRGSVTFSRCVMAWAGITVSGLDVHHVNMDTTDDRLGNLQALTKAEHAAAHADKDDLLWDADWYEYNSYCEGLLRINQTFLLSDEDIAVAIAAALEPPTHEIEELSDADRWDLAWAAMWADEEIEIM